MKLFDTYLYKVNNHYNANRDVYVHNPVYSFDGEEPQKQSADSLYRNEIETKPNGVKYKYEPGPTDRFDVTTKTPIVDTLYKKSYVFDSNTFGLTEEYIGQKPDVRQNGYMKEVSSGKSLELEQNLIIPYINGCYERKFIEVDYDYVSNYVDGIEIPNLDSIDDELIIIGDCNLRKGQLPIRYDLQIPKPKDYYGREIITFVTTDGIEGEVPYRVISDDTTINPSLDYLIDNDIKYIINERKRPTVVDKFDLDISDINLTSTTNNNFYESYRFKQNYTHKSNTRLDTEVLSYYNDIIKEGVAELLSIKTDNLIDYSKELFVDSYTNVISNRATVDFNYYTSLYDEFDKLYNDVRISGIDYVYTPEYKLNEYDYRDITFNVAEIPDYKTSILSKLSHNPTAKYVFSDEIKIYDNFRSITEASTHNQDIRTDTYEQNKVPYVFDSLNGIDYDLYVRELPTYIENPYRFTFNKLVDYRHHTTIDTRGQELYTNKPYSFDRITEIFSELDLSSKDQQLRYVHSQLDSIENNNSYSYFVSDSPDYLYNPYVFTEHKLFTVNGTNTLVDRTVYKAPNKPYKEFEPRLSDFNGEKERYEQYTHYFKFNHKGVLYDDSSYVLPKLGSYLREEIYTGSLYSDNGTQIPKLGSYLREEIYTGDLYRGTDLVLYTHSLDKYSKDLIKSTETLRYDNPLDDKAQRTLPLGTFELRYDNPLDDKAQRTLPLGTFELRYDNPLDDKATRELPLGTFELRYDNPLDDKATRELPLGTFELRYDNPLDDKATRELPLGTFELRYDNPLDDKAQRELPTSTELLSYTKVSKLHLPLELSYSTSHIYDGYLSNVDDITVEIDLDSVYTHNSLTSSRTDLDPSFKLRSNDTYETGRYIFDTELKYQSHITRLHEPKRNYFPDLNIDKSLPQRDTSSYVAGKYLGPVYKHSNTLLGTNEYKTDNLYKSLYVDYVGTELDLSTIRYDKPSKIVNQDLPERTDELYVSTAYLDLAYKHSLLLDTSTQFRIDNLYKNISKHLLADISETSEFRYRPESKQYYLKDIVSRTSLPVELDVYLKQPSVYFPQYITGTTEYRADNLYKNVVLDSTQLITDLSVLRYNKGITLVNKGLFDRHSEPYFVSNYLASVYKHSTSLSTDKKVFNTPYRNLPIELTQYTVTSEFRYPSPVIVNKNLPELHSSEYTVNNYLKQTSKNSLSLVEDKKVYNTPYRNISLTSVLDFSSDVYVRYSNKEIIVNKNLPQLFSGEYKVDNYLAQTSKHSFTLDDTKKIFNLPYRKVTVGTSLDVSQLGTFRYSPSKRIINDSLPQSSTNVYSVDNYLSAVSNHPYTVFGEKQLVNLPYRKVTVDSGLELSTDKVLRYTPSARIINDSLPQSSTNLYLVDNYLKQTSKHPLLIVGEKQLFTLPYRNVTVDSGLDVSQLGTFRYSSSKRIINDSLPQLHSSEYTVNNYLKQTSKHSLSIVQDKKVYNTPYKKVEAQLDLTSTAEFRYPKSYTIVNKGLPQLHSSEYTFDNYLKSAFKHPSIINIGKPSSYTRLYKNITAETELLSNIQEFRYDKKSVIVNKDIFDRHSEPYFVSNYLASAYKHELNLSIESDKEFFKPYRKIDTSTLVSYDLGEFRYDSRTLPIQQTLFSHSSDVYVVNNYLKQPSTFELPYTGSEFRYSYPFIKVDTGVELETYTGDFRYTKPAPVRNQDLFDRASQIYISNSYLKQVYTHFPLSQRGYQEVLYTDIYNKISRHETPNLSVGEINYKNYTRSFILDSVETVLETEYVVNYENYTKTLDINTALFTRHSEIPEYDRYLKQRAKDSYIVTVDEPQLKSNYGINFVYEATDIEVTIDFTKVYNNYLNVAKRNIGTVSSVALDTPLYNNKTILRNDLNKTESIEANVADELLPEFRYVNKHNKIYTGAFRNRPIEVYEQSNETYLTTEKNKLFHKYSTLDLVVNDRIQVSPYTFEFKKHIISVPQLVSERINVPRYLTDVLSDNITTSYSIDRQIHSKNYFLEDVKVGTFIESTHTLDYVRPTYIDVQPQFKSLNLVSIDKHIHSPSYFNSELTPEITTSYSIDRQIHSNNYLGEDFRLYLDTKDTTVLKYTAPLYKDIDLQSTVTEYTPRIDSHLYSHDIFENLTRYNIDTYGRKSEFKMSQPSWSRTDIKQPYNDLLIKDQYRETFSTYHSLESVDFRPRYEQDHQVVIYDKPWYLIKPDYKNLYSDVFSTPGVYNLDDYNKRYTNTNEYDNLNIAESGIRYESDKSRYFLGLEAQEKVFKPFRYKNDLNKFSKSGFNLGTKQDGYEKEVYLVKARALFLSDIYVDEDILSKFRYDNYNFGVKTRDEIKLDKTRGQNYLTRLSVPSYIDDFSTVGGIRYNNTLDKYTSLTIDKLTLSTPRYSNYLNDLSVPFETTSNEVIRYNNTLEKYNNTFNSVTLGTPRYDNYLTNRIVSDYVISTDGIRYNNTLEKYTSLTIDELKLSTPRYINYLVRTDVTEIEVSTQGIRYNNTLEKYNNTFNSVTLGTPRYNNYLTSRIVSDYVISTQGIRYNNTLEKYNNTFNSVTLGTPRYNNYLNDLSVSFETVSVDGIRYNNTLEKYNNTFNGVTLGTPRYNNYLNDLSVSFEELTSTEFKYDNNLDKYTSLTIDELKLSTPRYDNYLNDLSVPFETVSVDGIRYNNTLEKYVSLDIDTKVVSDRVFNYLPSLNDFYLIDESVLPEFRYEGRKLEHNLVKLDIKVSAEFTHRYLQDVIVEPIQTYEEFKYESDLSKYSTYGYDVSTAHKQTFNYNNNLEKYAVEPIIDVQTSDVIRYNNNLEKYSVNDVSYKTTIDSSFKYDNNISSYTPEIEVTDTLSENVSTFRYDNNVAKYNNRVITTQVTLNTKIYQAQLDRYLDKTPDTRYLLERKIYENDVFKVRSITKVNIDDIIISKPDFGSSYNRNSISTSSLHTTNLRVQTAQVEYYNRIQTSKKRDYRVYILQDEHRFTDIEFRFETRGPINHNPYGNDVKVYYSENTRQEVAWERDIHEQPELTKNRGVDYGFYPHSRQNNSRETIVDQDVPAATIQGQIDYHFGDTGLLKYDQLEATYELDGYSFPIAAPKNMSLRGPMRYPASTTIRHIIETDPSKINWTTVVPLYPEDGDRTSLFSDRFFLQ